jgi:hypothetical protein
MIIFFANYVLLLLAYYYYITLKGILPGSEFYSVLYVNSIALILSNINLKLNNIIY